MLSCLIAGSLTSYTLPCASIESHSGAGTASSSSTGGGGGSGGIVGTMGNGGDNRAGASVTCSTPAISCISTTGIFLVEGPVELDVVGPY